MEKPQRMCVICRTSTDKDRLLRFTETEGAYVYDEKQINQKRGIYVCQNLSCIEKLSKHKKYKIPMQDLATVASKAKKEDARFLNSLKMMKNGGVLTFGIELVEDNIKKIEFMILARDCNKKNSDKIIKLCKDNKIKYIITASKRELGEVFSKEEINVIGIMDKKSARGLLS